jgi:phosphoesterase RecJ-like protein
VNAVSTTEVIRKWIAAAAPNVAVDEPLATALLTGMIAKTKSFRTPNVTPKTLSTASELIALGAKREDIVHGLWRNRDVATLKLWGRTLARLEQDRELGLIWATLGENDFLETGAGAETLEGVVDELLGYAPEAKVVALISQQQKNLHVSLHAVPPFSAAELARPFQGNGSREHARFVVQDGANLVESARQVVYRLRATMKSLKA